MGVSSLSRNHASGTLNPESPNPEVNRTSNPTPISKPGRKTSAATVEGVGWLPWSLGGVGFLWGQGDYLCLINTKLSKPLGRARGFRVGASRARVLPPKPNTNTTPDDPKHPKPRLHNDPSISLLPSLKVKIKGLWVRDSSAGVEFRG